MTTQTETKTPTKEGIGPALAAPLGALMMGLLFDFLFYGRSLGVSVPVFLWAATLSAWATARYRGRPASPSQAAVAAGALAFSTLVAWRAAPELVAANLAAGLYLFALLLTPWLKNRPLEDMEEEEYLSSPRDVLVESVRQGKNDLGELCRTVKTGGVPLGAIATGALASIPILAGFLALMMSADLLFKSLLERLIGHI